MGAGQLLDAICTKHAHVGYLIGREAESQRLNNLCLVTLIVKNGAGIVALAF